jgi:hypothetical protein
MPVAVAPPTKRTLFDVRDYGAVLNGIADDTLPVQATIDAAKAAGAGDVRIPFGTALCNAGVAPGVAPLTPYTRLGHTYALSIISDNIHIVGPGTIRTTANASCLFIAGSGKPGGPQNWVDYAIWADAVTTVYAISPATRAASTVTLTTPAQASNFVAGDNVYIRSGQLTANTQNSEPDAEINRVVSANATTGVIVLERPLCKDYVQEYQSAAGALSQTTNPGGYINAPFGIAKITDRTLTNVGYGGGIRFENTADRNCVLIRGAIEWLEIDGVQFDCYRTAMDPIEWRGRVHNERARMYGPGNNNGVLWPVCTGTGCSDNDIQGIHAEAPNSIAQLHMHEGTSRAQADHVKLLSAPGKTGAEGSISVRGRAYGVALGDSIEVVNWQTSGAGIWIGDNTGGGGSIGAVSVRGAGTAISVNARNWKVSEDARLSGPLSYVTQGAAVQSIAPRSPLLPLGVQMLVGWVSDDVLTQEIGTLPAYSFVVAAYFVRGIQAFNGTTPIGQIGTDASTALILANHDLAGTTVSTALPTTRYTAVDRVLKIFVTHGATAPTTGKVLAVVEYVRIPQEVP